MKTKKPSDLLGIFFGNIMLLLIYTTVLSCVSFVWKEHVSTFLYIEAGCVVGSIFVFTYLLLQLRKTTEAKAKLEAGKKYKILAYLWEQKMAVMLFPPDEEGKQRIVAIHNDNFYPALPDDDCVNKNYVGIEVKEEEKIKIKLCEIV